MPRSIDRHEEPDGNGQIRIASIELSNAVSAALKAAERVVVAATSVVALRAGDDLRKSGTDPVAVIDAAKTSFGNARQALTQLRETGRSYDSREALGAKVISMISGPDGISGPFPLLELPQRAQKSGDEEPESEKNPAPKGKKNKREPTPRKIISEVQVLNLRIMIGDVPQEFRGGSNAEIIKAVYGEKAGNTKKLRRAEAAYYNGKQRVLKKLKVIGQTLEERGIPTTLPLLPAAVDAFRELGQPDNLAEILNRSGRKTLGEVISGKGKSELPPPVEHNSDRFTPSQRQLIARILRSAPDADVKLADVRTELDRYIREYRKNLNGSNSESLRKVVYGRLINLLDNHDFGSALRSFEDSEDKLLLTAVRKLRGEKPLEEFLNDLLAP